MILTPGAGSDDDRVKRAHGSELRPPRFVTIGRLAHWPGEDAFFGNDNEQSEVNRINAFAQNAALPAPLTLRFKETDCILEVIGIDVSPVRLKSSRTCTVH